MKTVLCVEDDIKILHNNKVFLTRNGYNIVTAENLAQAKKYLESETPDVVLLDIMLPDGNGLEYLKEIRADGNAVPVIMLTAWGETSDKIHGLKAGANDYIAKPFNYEELLARIEAVIRSSLTVPEKLEIGSIMLEPISGKGYVNGVDMTLTQKEFAVLLLLFKNKDKIINAEYLYRQVWGQDILGSKRALENTISRLRQKLKGGDYTISTEYKNGYLFERGYTEE